MPFLSELLRPPGPVHFELSEQRRDGARLIRIAGELDVLTVPKLAARLDDLVRSEPDNLIVDLEQATFIDSAGLHALLNAQRRLTRRGHELSVICGAGPVRQVIETARLADTLNLVSGN